MLSSPRNPAYELTCFSKTTAPAHLVPEIAHWTDRSLFAAQNVTGETLRYALNGWWS